MTATIKEFLPAIHWAQFVFVHKKIDVLAMFLNEYYPPWSVMRKHYIWEPYFNPKLERKRAKIEGYKLKNKRSQSWKEQFKVGICLQCKEEPVLTYHVGGGAFLCHKCKNPEKTEKQKKKDKENEMMKNRIGRNLNLPVNIFVNALTHAMRIRLRNIEITISDEEKNDIEIGIIKEVEKYMTREFAFIKIARENNIIVSEKEYEEQIMKIAGTFRTTPDELKELLSQRNIGNQIMIDILYQKIRELLYEKAKIEDVDEVFEQEEVK